MISRDNQSFVSGGDAEYEAMRMLRFSEKYLGGRDPFAFFTDFVSVCSSEVPA